MSIRRISPWGLAIVAVGAIGLWWFFPREDKNVWRFSPDVSLSGGSSRARSVAFSPDGHTLAVSTLVFPATYPRGIEDRGSRQRRCEVQLWDVPSRQRQRTLIISDADVPRGANEPEMVFSRDGRQLRFWGMYTTTWDVATATRLSIQTVDHPVGEQHEFGLPISPLLHNLQLARDCRGVISSADGLWYAGEFLGESVKVWRRAAWGKPWQLVGALAATTFGNSMIYAITLSRDGKLLAVAQDGQDGQSAVQLFETQHLQLWKSLTSANWITEVTFSPDGQYLLGCGGTDSREEYSRRGGVLNFWNLATGTLEYTVNAPKVLHAPVFSPNGHWVGATEGEATVFVCQSPLYKKKSSSNS